MRRIAAKWVNLGVVREISTSGSAYFEVMEDYGHVEEGCAGGAGDGAGGAGASSTNQIARGDEDEDEDMLAQNQEELEQQALVYENYVRGMLSNFGELPLDRIHNMLSMFVPGDDNSISAQQLRGLLSHLCNQEKLVFDGSAYKLA